MKKAFNFYTLILIGIFLLLYLWAEVWIGWNYISIILYIIQLILFFKVSINEKNDLRNVYIRPFFILLFSSLIVNLQSIINVLLDYGQFSDYNKGMRFLNPYMDRCLYIGLIELLLLTFGYINYHCFNKHYCIKSIYSNSLKNTKYKKYCKLLFLLLFILSFIGFISTIDMVSFITGADYQNSGSAEREFKNYDYYETLLTVFMYIYISFMSFHVEKKISLSKFIRDMGFPFWIIFWSYLILRLFSGDRGPVMYSLLLIFFSYIFVSKKNFKLRTIVPLGVLGIFCISLLGIVRQQSSTLSFIDKVQSSYKSVDSKNKTKSISPFTQELAGSLDCTALALRGIDIESIHYGNGKYFSYTLISSVPGCNSIMRMFDKDFNYRDYQTSEIITKEWAGDKYPFGLGMTPIADIYIDFGILGILFLFPLFGMIYKNIDMKLYNRSPYISIPFLIFILYIASYSVYIPRSSFIFVFSKAFYAIIIYIILSSCIRIFMRIKMFCKK